MTYTMTISEFLHDYDPLAFVTWEWKLLALVITLPMGIWLVMELLPMLMQAQI